MKKKDLEKTALEKPISAETTKQYVDVVNSDPKYALVADPDGSLMLTEQQKQFIELYINFRNFAVVSKMMKIDLEKAVEIYQNFNVKNEIDRINAAIYHHQYAHKILELDEMGGYLSSLVEDKFVPEADRLKPMDKVKVIDMILKIQGAKVEAAQNQNIIDLTDQNDAVKELSVASIQNMINMIESGKTREIDAEIEKELEESTMSPSDIEALKSLPTQEIVKILNEANKKK